MQWLRQRAFPLLRRADGISNGLQVAALTGHGVAAPAAHGAGGILEAFLRGFPGLADSTWLAVPKRRVTPHRRGNRNATKYIRFVPVVSQCSKCEKVFKQHSLPRKCEEEECPSFVLRAKPQ